MCHQHPFPNKLAPPPEFNPQLISAASTQEPSARNLGIIHDSIRLCSTPSPLSLYALRIFISQALLEFEPSTTSPHHLDQWNFFLDGCLAFKSPLKIIPYTALANLIKLISPVAQLSYR